MIVCLEKDIWERIRMNQNRLPRKNIWENNFFIVEFFNILPINSKGGNLPLYTAHHHSTTAAKYTNPNNTRMIHVQARQSARFQNKTHVFKWKGSFKSGPVTPSRTPPPLLLSSRADWLALIVHSSFSRRELDLRTVV